MLLRKVIASTGREGWKGQGEIITARKGDRCYVKSAYKGKMQTEVPFSFYHLYRVKLKKKSKTIQVSLIQQGLQNFHNVMKLIYEMFFMGDILIVCCYHFKSIICMADEDAIQHWRSRSFFYSGMWSSLGYPTGVQGGQTASDYLQQTELLTPPLPSVFSTLSQ